MGQLRQHNKPGQVSILSSQAVIYPGTNSWIASKTVAGVHMVVCRRVIHRLHLQPTIKTQVIGHLGQVFPELVHVRPALPGFAELKRTLHIIPFA